MVGVIVINKGRHPTTIHSVAFSAGDFSFTPLASRVGPDMPFRLDGYSAESWYLDVREAVAAQQSWVEVMKRPASEVRAVAKLATGREKSSRNSVWLPQQ